MPGQSRPSFKSGVSATIFTNKLKLIKGNTVRDKFLVLADSIPFITDANSPNGYLSIDSSGLVNISFIKSATPSGKYLKDDGTWGVISGSLPSQTGNSGKFLTTDGTTASWSTINPLPTQTGNSGKFLTTDGTTASWSTINPLPTQTGNSGKFLTTDGSTASWATIDALPTQTGNSGKFLTTDGSTASWATINPLPTQTGNSGKFLTTDGTTASWSSDFITNNNRAAIKTTLATNVSLNVGGVGFVNYGSNYTSGNFYSYQGYGNWESIGSNAVGPAALGTILAFGGFRSSQWQGVTFHAAGSEAWRIASTGSFSNTGSSGTAWIHLKAGTSTVAPIRLTSASLKTSSDAAGEFQFLSDKLYFTITTGLSVKEVTLNDSALASTAMPFVVNGRLTSNALVNSDGTKMSVGAALSGGYNGSVRGHYNSRPSSATGRAYVVEDAGVSTGVVALEVRGYSAITYQIAAFGSGVAGSYAGTSISLANSFAHLYESAAYPSGLASGASGRNINIAASHTFLTGTGTGDSASRISAAGFRVCAASDVTTDATAYIDIGASVSAKAQFRLRPGAAVTSPFDGEMWYTGSFIKFRLSSTTLDFVFASTTLTSGAYSIVDSNGRLANGSISETGGIVSVSAKLKVVGDVGFYNTAPITQPNTSVASSTLTSVGGVPLMSDDTFDGYTLAQVIKSLRNLGLIQ